MFKSIIKIPNNIRGAGLTILFTIICLCVYEWGLFRKEKLRRFLENKIVALNAEKQAEKVAHIDLMEQMEAETDPEWVELVLRKNLGVIGEGETKIVFQVIE